MMIHQFKKAVHYSVLLGMMVFSHVSVSQTFIDSSFVGKRIVSIQIIGNDRTQSHIIFREMKQKEGDRLDFNMIESDRKRIQNLDLFNRVVIQAQPDGDQVQLNIIVTEQWYVFPYPILFIHDRDWSKFSYGAGIVHLNFRGRRETLNLGFWLGYNPSVQFSYANPWIGGKHHLITQIRFYHNRIRSKHFKEAIDEKHLGMEWTLGKRFGYHTVLGVTFGYREVVFSPPEMVQTLSPSGKDRLPSLDLFYTWDRRDLQEYPHEGWLVSLFARQTGFSRLTAHYLRTGFELRQYFPLTSTWTLAMRLKANLSGGEIPLYDHVYLGYSERIRGYFFDVFEGENRALVSMAFRLPLVPIRYFDLSDHVYFQNLKFGAGLGFFIDSGLTWSQGEMINHSMFKSGYGVGLHLHLPYIHLLRLEWAINDQGRSQFIFDLYVDI
ncbi:hypothetical protein EH221_09120 [bacterium]|nr:MAG: hypothetical protein EH221_09120 [bacterium]